ncbi:MAG: hypothetical protein KDK33_15005, partial [Leptospiraceae bacterium]|nr:hypothetical protein [Leptospiraceae bacterium]
SEQRAAFLEGLEDYLNEADENSILVYTQKNWEGKDIPIGSINQSKAFQVYRQEFLAQMKEIKQRKDEEGLTGLLKNVAFYMALFAGIFTYLMIALLFSILRIEKHMAARSSR